MKKTTFLTIAALGLLAIPGLTAQTLEAHFKFDANLTDETGNYTLSTANAPSISYVEGADGTANGAITGLGIAEYLQTNENFAITGAADRTVTAWIKTSTGTNGANKTQRGLVNMGHKAASRRFTLMLIDNKVRNDIQAGGGTTASLPITNDNWKLLAVVFDGTANTSTIYVDGAEQLVIDWNGFDPVRTLDTSIRPLLIGNDLNSLTDRGFEGAIDDVRVYNGTLTQADVQALYDAANLSSDGISVQSVNVYPNPVQDQLVIDSDDVATVEIYDIVGRKVSIKTLVNRSLSLGGLSKGIYILNLKDYQNNYLTSIEVVKE